MVIIKQSPEGNIIINRIALARIVVFEMNAMSYCFEFCNKKGKPIKKFILGDDDNSKLNSIEIIGKNGVEIRVYCFIKKGYEIEACINELFDKIEEHYMKLGIDKPKILKAYIKGVAGEALTGEGFELIRDNEKILS